MTQRNEAREAVVAELREVYDALTPGAIERADLDGMAFAVERAIQFLTPAADEQGEGERIMGVVRTELRRQGVIWEPDEYSKETLMMQTGEAADLRALADALASRKEG